MAGAPVDAVARVPLFAELDKRELEQVARLFKERRFAAGETIAREGSGAAAFYLIDSGEASVTVGGQARSMLGAGDHFGEIALIGKAPRSATITAETDLKCWGLTAWEFKPIVESNPTIAWHLLETLAERLAQQ
jgi:CRP-like cAMP-binding protein